MGKTKITQPFSQSLQMQKLHDAISNSADKSSRISISGLIGSSLSILLAESFKKAEKPFLLILNDKEEAAYILNDLEQLVK